MLGRKLVLAALAGMALTTAVSVTAQSNNDDFTPLNSRIKRDRQFPTELHNAWGDQQTAVNRARSRAMLNQFSRCLYNRSREDSLDLLRRTDAGFVTFEQIGLDNDRAARNYGFRDCLQRVASNQGMGVQLRWSAFGLRQWLLQEAYFARYQDGPSWVKPGNVIGARGFPLSAQQANVQAAMDLTDCVVTADPYTADFLYRTVTGSEDEARALEALRPVLGSCLPQGQQVQLDPYMFRAWVGESLWHAANNSRPGPADTPQGTE
jgi:hypothetical protein